MSAASSAVARGMIPGSDQLVLSRAAITKTNKIPPITGIAGVNSTAKYGQLQPQQTTAVNEDYQDYIEYRKQRHMPNANDNVNNIPHL